MGMRADGQKAPIGQSTRPVLACGEQGGPDNVKRARKQNSKKCHNNKNE
jgi:hypothetical protein